MHSLHSYGSLLLDLAGRILFCGSSVAALAGRSADELTGRQVRALLPELPIREDTRGYNLAASIALFGTNWLPYRLSRDAEGEVPVEACVQHVFVDRAPALVVNLRWPEA